MTGVGEARLFFGFISYRLNAATTLYFVVSNTWRIGQQHFVLNKMYEEEHPGAGTKAPKPKPAIEPDEGGGKPPSPPPPTARRGGGPSGGASGGGTGNRPPNAARRKKKRKR